MGMKLYVGNLAFDATEQTLRAHFAACGGVADVEILTNARSGEPRGRAYVTMTSPAFAKAALERLNGAAFLGLPLRVSDAPIRPGQAEAAKVKIAQQFRERNNMTYDLDCQGTPLTLRIFPAEDELWRVEARSRDTTDSAVVIESAKTRKDALSAVGRSWSDKSDALRLPTLDWDAIALALTTVRAL